MSMITLDIMLFILNKMLMADHYGIYILFILGGSSIN